MDYQFKKVLICYDDSPASHVAFDKAVAVAKAFKSELHLVYVRTPGATKSNLEDKIELKSREINYPIHYIEKVGNVSRELQLVENEIGADLILLGAHGLNGFQPLWIGSNSMRVVSASDCPVITVQAAANNLTFSDIILPLDNSIETRQKVPYAVVFAQAFNSVVHILTVSKDSSPENKNRLDIYAKQTAQYLSGYGVQYTMGQKLGVNVAKGCMEYAAEKNAGLIMMMTETESNNWFMSNAAQQLINHSTVPVLSIHSRDLFIGGTTGY